MKKYITINREKFLDKLEERKDWDDKIRVSVIQKILNQAEVINPQEEGGQVIEFESEEEMRKFKPKKCEFGDHYDHIPASAETFNYRKEPTKECKHENMRIVDGDKRLEWYCPDCKRETKPTKEECKHEWSQREISNPKCGKCGYVKRHASWPEIKVPEKLGYTTKDEAGDYSVNAPSAFDLQEKINEILSFLEAH